MCIALRHPLHFERAANIPQYGYNVKGPFFRNALRGSVLLRDTVRCSVLQHRSANLVCLGYLQNNNMNLF